tara:strand:+ start:1006 stop:1299 length:294 start_codon:yes stop_codon:yes gene_type:complete
MSGTELGLLLLFAPGSMAIALVFGVDVFWVGSFTLDAWVFGKPPPRHKKYTATVSPGVVWQHEVSGVSRVVTVLVEQRGYIVFQLPWVCVVLTVLWR